MFEAYLKEDALYLIGRFDAAQVEKARPVFEQISVSVTVDFSGLEYISSAGLGVLLKTQKRLSTAGEALKLVKLNKHISDVFRYAGFDAIFEIQDA